MLISTEKDIDTRLTKAWTAINRLSIIWKSNLTDKMKRRHAGHCWRSKDELISDVLLWTPTYGRAKAAQTYIQQLCEDTGCSSEDLPEAMNDREKWRERVRDIRASGTRWWWWYIYIYIYIYKYIFVFLSARVRERVGRELYRQHLIQ